MSDEANQNYYYEDRQVYYSSSSNNNQSTRQYISSLYREPIIDDCKRCSKYIYPLEGMGPVMGYKYHKLCFRCHACDRLLDFKTYKTNMVDLNDRGIYCALHFPRNGRSYDTLYGYHRSKSTDSNLNEEINYERGNKIEKSQKHSLSNDYLDNNQAYRTDDKQPNSFANVILGSLDDILNQESNQNLKNSNINVNKYDGAYSSSSALSSSEEKIFHDDLLNNKNKISMSQSEHSIYYEEQIEETYSSSTQMTTMKTTTTTTTLKTETLSSNEMLVDEEINEKNKFNSFIQPSSKKSNDNQEHTYDNMTTFQLNKNDIAHGSNANLKNIINEVRGSEIYSNQTQKQPANNEKVVLNSSESSKLEFSKIPLQKHESDSEEETNMHLKNIIRDIKETDEYERLSASKKNQSTLISQHQEKQLVTGSNHNLKNIIKEERESNKRDDGSIYSYQPTKGPQLPERHIEIKINQGMSNTNKELNDLTKQSENQVIALSSSQIKYEIPQVENQNLKRIVMDIKDLDRIEKKFAAFELEKNKLTKSNLNANSISTDAVKIEKKTDVPEDQQLSYLRYMIAEAIHTDKSDKQSPKAKSSISATLSNASSIASNMSSNSNTYNSYKQSSHYEKEEEYVENKYSSSTYEEDSLKQSIHFTDVFGDLSTHSAYEDSLSKQSQLNDLKPLPIVKEPSKASSNLQQIVLDINAIDAQNKPPQSQTPQLNKSQQSTSQPSSSSISKTSEGKSNIFNLMGEAILTDSKAHHEMINQKTLPANSYLVDIMDEAIATDIYKQSIEEESLEESLEESPQESPRSLPNQKSQDKLNLFNIMGEAVLADFHSQQKQNQNNPVIQKQANLYDIVEEALLTDSYMHSQEVNQEHFSTSKTHSDISLSSSSTQVSVYKVSETTSNTKISSDELNYPPLPKRLSDSTMNNLYNIMAEAVGKDDRMKPTPSTSADSQPIPSLSEIVVEILTHDGNPRVEYKPLNDTQTPQIQNQPISQQIPTIDLKRPNPYLYSIMAEALAANGYQLPQQEQKNPPQNKPLNLTPSEMNLLVGQDSGLGVLRMTVHYDELRTRLSVTLHEARNLKNESSSKSSKDDSKSTKDDSKNVIDPYVKVVLTPDDKPSLKRKTKIVKNNLNPIWQETFDYSMTQSQALSKELKIFVKIEKGLFNSKESRFLGEIQLKLNELDILQPFTRWYFLQTVSKSSLKEK